MTLEQDIYTIIKQGTIYEDANGFISIECGEITWALLNELNTYLDKNGSGIDSINASKKKVIVNLLSIIE